MCDNIWSRWKSEAHTKLASEGNANELDFFVREGLKRDNGTMMWSTDAQSEAKLWQWLIPCYCATKKPINFHSEAFDKMSDPLPQVFITIISGPRAAFDGVEGAANMSRFWTMMFKSQYAEVKLVTNPIAICCSIP